MADSNSKDPPGDSPDYRSSLFLPETDFPMRAGLPTLEPKLLARWHDMGLYGRLRAAAKGREKFVLHDGPPYANGHIHIGHALNKILKDIVVRSQQMLGKDAPYVPGWDCHGLPIEWKIEENYRAAGKNKDDVPVLEFRRECREFAAHWMDIQREEFKRLGVLGDWDNPYTTMSFAAEAQIVREFLKFLMNGGLYRGSKPVLWSVVEKTALAEAEVEYYDHVSTTIFVAFPIIDAKLVDLQSANIVIWTTTPWTIPGNRAIAFRSDLDYVAVKVIEMGEGRSAALGQTLVIAKPLLAAFLAAAAVTRHDVAWQGKGLDLVGTICAHPLRGRGYDFDVPLLPALFVDDETGTGFVHIAPGHGSDDFELGVKHGLEVPFTVDEDGVFYDHVPLFAGVKILHTDGKKLGKDGEANGAVIRELAGVGRLLAKGKLTHSYPHSWRSKVPLIFRNTPQWFISMEKNDLKAKALKAIDEVRWVPPQGRNRIYSMVENRPDWVISRQRAWGVPLTLFVNKKTGELLRDEAVNERIVAAVEKHGADAWFAADPKRFLGSEHDAADYEQVMDILDVWFDSGSTHAFVLEPKGEWPASLYLEGSDQHRGWFHSSLLESCGTRGRAPYDAVLTHGFILDEKGEEKMSKSKGNTLSPQDVTKQSGAEILRLWVASSDFTNDIRFGPGIVQSSVDVYRKLRNTLRFILANLAGFDESERLSAGEMPELDRLILHRLAELDELVRNGYEAFDFNRVLHALVNFCTLDLSAFYFDIRKDALYCDRPDDVTRRSCRSVLDALLSCLTAWFAPVLCFTAEEAWLTRNDGPLGSVHLRPFPPVPAAWHDSTLAEKWRIIRRLRRVVTGALEVERREKRIGSSLEAAPVVYVEDPAYVTALAGLDLAEIAITSQASLIQGPGPAGAFRLDEIEAVAVEPRLAKGNKCQRCWKILPEVDHDSRYPHLDPRCVDAVRFAERGRQGAADK